MTSNSTRNDIVKTKCTVIWKSTLTLDIENAGIPKMKYDCKTIRGIPRAMFQYVVKIGIDARRQPRSNQRCKLRTKLKMNCAPQIRGIPHRARPKLRELQHIGSLGEAGDERRLVGTDGSATANHLFTPKKTWIVTVPRLLGWIEKCDHMRLIFDVWEGQMYRMASWQNDSSTLDTKSGYWRMKIADKDEN